MTLFRPTEARNAKAASLAPNFHDRACAFAVAAGCVVFILAILVGAASAGGERKALTNALVLAIICGTTSWAATMRIIAETAKAIDRLILRVRAAADGDTNIALDKRSCEELPELVNAIDRLLDRVRSSLTSFHDLAMHDTVTGLPNRLHLRRVAEQQLYADIRPAGTSGVVFIDLDRFKAVNDTLGHHIGDQLLSMIAARLNIVVHGGGEAEDAPPLHRPIVARLGGDEFTIFIPSAADDAALRRIGRRVLSALAEPFEISGHSIEIGASIGIALHDGPAGGGYAALMRNADLAMYHAKAKGRGQIQIYSPELRVRSENRHVIEAELRSALTLEQFTLFFQPQVTIDRSRVVTAEALLRWQHPQGLRMPASFIDIAEDSGLIIEIGRWAMGHIAATLARWHDHGFNTRIGMNVSGRQLESGSFFRDLESAMETHGAPWDMLELEITETCLTPDDAELIGHFNRLRDRGVVIAIDDFGIGYSNLARLRSLPIDRLKIDRSLIADIAHSGEAATISHAIVALAHGLGYGVVAEGVENALQAEVLKVMGADMIQGYLVARPMPEADFPGWAAQFAADNTRLAIRV